MRAFLLFAAATLSAVDAGNDTNCTEALKRCDVACCGQSGCNCAVYTNRNGHGFGAYAAEKWCRYSDCIQETGADCANAIETAAFEFNTTGAGVHAVATHERDNCMRWNCGLNFYEHASICIAGLKSCTSGSCSLQCKSETHACRRRHNCAEDVHARCLTDPEYAGCPNTQEICDYIFTPTQAPSDSSKEVVPAWLWALIAAAVVTAFVVAVMLCLVTRSWTARERPGVAKPVEGRKEVEENRSTTQMQEELETDVDSSVQNPLKTGFKTASVAQVSFQLPVTVGSEPPQEPTPPISEQSIAKVIQSIQSVRSDDGEPVPSPSTNALPTPDILLSVKSDRSTFDKWQRSHLIGKGSYGDVYLGILHTGLFIAVKVVDLAKGLNDKAVAEILGEVSLMKEFSHRNITQYLDVEYDRHLFRLNIFMEFVDGGALSTLVKRLPSYLDESLCKRYTIQILNGLKYLHDMAVVHRDIKGENVLIRTDGLVKLADFGCSKKIADICTRNRGCTTLVGTPYWMAPEVIGGNTAYGSSSDIWSVGCTVSEMLNKGLPPWPTYPTMWAAIYHIASSQSLPTNLPSHVSELATGFMHACLVLKPEDRPTAGELLEHPFLKSVGDPVAPPPEPGKLFGEEEGEMNC